MHFSLFYTSYFAFQGRGTASDFCTASMLSHWFPITLELLWHEADYTSTASRSLWPCLFPLTPLSRASLTFCCSRWSALSTCICLFCLFLLFFLILWHAVCVCVSVCERGREREWVHIMNNTWCGFLVSETDRRWGWWAAPRVLFFPPHTVVKQTTSAEGSPISTLLLLYSHRQDLSPSICNAGTGWTAWPLWTIPIPEICNTFNPHMVANSSNGEQLEVQFFYLNHRTQMGLLISAEQRL